MGGARPYLEWNAPFIGMNMGTTQAVHNWVADYIEQATNE